MYLIDSICFSLSKQGYFPNISKWKIFSDEEHELALKADISQEEKIKYVQFYKKADETYYNNGLKYLEKVFDRFDKKLVRGGESVNETNPVVIDILYSLHRFGCSFEEYYLYNFAQLNAEGRSKFITDKVRYYLYNQMNLNENHTLFRNKLLTYDKFKSFYGRKLIGVKSADDYALFNDFCSNVNSFIVKKIDGDCGRGAKIYSDIKGKSFLNVFKEIHAGDEVVIEELIMQSPELSQFHPQSVNTVRMMTINCKDGIHIFHPFFRMGRGGAIVDNGGAGGIFTAIDSDTGICYTAGIDENGQQYINHPDTGVQIVGFRIPKWNEAMEMARELAQLTTNRYVGWDLALTEKGWVMVEGNDCGQFLMQIADKTGRLQEILDLIKLW